MLFWPQWRQHIWVTAWVSPGRVFPAWTPARPRARVRMRRLNMVPVFEAFKWADTSLRRQERSLSKIDMSLLINSERLQTHEAAWGGIARGKS